MLYCHDRQNCCATSPACTCSKRWDDGEILDLSKTSPTDSELIKRAQQDPQEFGAIYERYVQNIYNYVYYRTGNEVDAEDLTARVFLRAMNHMPSYKERGLPLSAWLYRIAHNLVANWYRDGQRRVTVPLDTQVSADAESEQPEKVTESNEQTAQLLQAIRALPDERQELLILKFIERLPNAEIARMMRRSEGAVKSLYHRTLLTLRKELLNGRIPHG